VAQLLIQPVRYPVLLKYLGRVLVVMAALNFVPAVAAVLVGELELAPYYTALSAILLVWGWLLNFLLPPEELKFREAVTLAGIIYFLSALVTATEWWWGSGLPFFDSFFDAMSAITTTGLGVLDTPRLPRTILFTRAWLQWLGGLGIIVLTLTVLIRSGPTAVRVLSATVGERISPSAVQTTKILWRLYFLLTALCLVAYWLGGLSFFESLCQSLATLSTGGFATTRASMAAAPSAVLVFATLFMIIGGSNLQRLHAGRGLWRDSQLRLMLLLITVFSLLVFVTLLPTYAWPEALRHAVFQTASAQTTTGFSSLSIRELPPGAKCVLIAAMYIGGSLGSTAGGIKILRFLILVKLIHLMLVRLLQPREVVSHLRIGRETVGREEIEQVVVISFMFGLVVFATTAFFIAWGYEPLDAAFDVFSAAGTVGLSTGVTSPGLPLLHKGLLCLNMWMGRLEVLHFLVLVYPRTWIKWR
jgi:trk system potassium uptake protein TrkH